jgi:glutamyl/glutaminyl-tRNA synthetase
MKFNTRFNPTVNGPLHLGHLYAVLVNYHEAHRSGGKFVLRFDDTQRSWNFKFRKTDAVEMYKQQMLDDLEWLGIEPDQVSHQSKMMDEVEDLLFRELDYCPAPEAYSTDPGAEVVGFGHQVYPYTDRLTVEKVIMDMLDGANWIIRGYDLITEDCLYKHFCAKLGIFQPRMSYIPRLNFPGGGIISKTEGNYKIEQFGKAGIDPEAVLSLLARDCLKVTDFGWSFDNILEKPTLGAWADEVLNVPA